MKNKENREGGENERKKVENAERKGKIRSRKMKEKVDTEENLII